MFNCLINVKGSEMKLKKSVVATLCALFAPRVVQAPSLSLNGAMADPTSLNSALIALGANGQSSAGGINFNAQAGSTYTASALSNALMQFTVGSAMTLTLDYAYNIAKLLPQPLTVGEAFTFQIVTNASTTIATPTLSDTAVTLSGTTSVLAASSRWYQGVLTQVTSTVGTALTSGSSFTSIAQVGSTNAFTVTLGTNAITPTVGNLIYIGTTAGTLPAGWYPIVKVSSATSFVIATPAGTTWTCTAATLNATGAQQVAPATYSPLITITGLWALVVSTASV